MVKGFTLLLFFIPAILNCSAQIAPDIPLPVSTRTIFVELAGNGFILSVNYDQRFHQQSNGSGYRIGIGGLSVSDYTLITIPAAVNWLIGANGKYFETGIGMTYWNSTQTEYSYGQHYLVHDHNAEGVLTFGYRRQPVHGGFNYRIAINPLFGKEDAIFGASGGNGVFVLPFAGFSFGYSF